MKKKVLLILCAILTATLVGCGADAEKVTYKNVDAQVKEADELYEAELYEDALNAYLEAMEENVKDVAARKGVFHCQLAMGNYNMAYMNLNMLQQMDPYDADVYELYIELSKETDDMSYAINAVSTAKQYNVEAFLDKLPQTPEISVESGDYDTKLDVVLECDDDAEVYYSIYSSYVNLNSVKYKNSITIMGEDVSFSAYSVKDGYPSVLASANYNVTYEGQPVTFKDSIMEELVQVTLENAGISSSPITDLACYQIDSLNMYDLRRNYDYDEYDQLKIHTLDDLAYMPNLGRLDLYEQDEIQNYEGISYCPGLYNVELTYCGLTDINFLSETNGIAYLYLNNNELKNLDGIAHMENLNSLYVCDNRDLVLDDYLLECDNLSSLEFNDEMLKDYSILGEMENLQYLNIVGIKDVDFDEIAKLTKLSNLHISYDYSEDESAETVSMDDLSFLDNLTELKNLSLSNIKDASQLNHIYGLKNLTYLYLYSSPVTDDENVMNALKTALPNCDIRY